MTLIANDIRRKKIPSISFKHRVEEMPKQNVSNVEHIKRIMDSCQIELILEIQGLFIIRNLGQ